MSSSKYTKTMAEAYAEMHAPKGELEEEYLEEIPEWMKKAGKAYVDTGKEAIRQTGNLVNYVTRGQGSPSQRKETPKGPIDAYKKTGQEALRQAGNLANYVTKGEGSPSAAGGTKPKNNKGETEAEKMARRRAVGLTDDPKKSAQRAKESQAAAKPKIDAANQARKDNKAAGKTSSNLPSNYKETEAKEFEKADKFRPGAGTSSLPASVQREVKAAAKPTPKPTLNRPKLDASGVGSGTSNFSAPKPTTPTPRPSGSGMKRRPTGRAEMRAANIAKTQSRPRSTPKGVGPTPRLDAATSGIKPMSDEFKALGDAYQSMYQLDELFPGAGEGAAAAVGGALGGPLGAVLGAGATGALTGKDKKKKAAGAGGGAAIGGALGGPVGAAIGAGVGGALGEEAEAAYQRWLEEQMTAGKSYGQPSGLDLRTTGQKMNQIKKSVQQNDKMMGKIQPPPGV